MSLWACSRGLVGAGTTRVDMATWPVLEGFNVDSSEGSMTIDM